MSGLFEIHEKLKSTEWSERSWAQSELEQLEDDQQWKQFLYLIKDESFPLVMNVTLILCRQIRKASPSVAYDIFSECFFAESPVTRFEESSIHLIEALLSTPSIFYRAKVDLLCELLRLHRLQRPDAEFGLLYLTRTVGILRAKMAVPELEHLLAQDDDTLVLEAISALKSIGIRSSAAALESLFQHENQNIVAAAIEAHAAIEYDWIKALRSSHIYRKGNQKIKMALIRSAIYYPPLITSLLLLRFLRVERKKENIHRIIRMLSRRSTLLSIWVLINEAVSGRSSQMRSMARVGVDTICTENYYWVIQLALLTGNRWLIQLAVLQLPKVSLKRARRLFQKMLKNYDAYDAMVRQAVVEVSRSLLPDVEVENWLLDRIFDEDLIQYSAIQSIMGAPEPPIDHILHSLLDANDEAVSSFLYLCANNQNLEFSEVFSEQLKQIMVTRSDFTIRSLCAQILLIRQDYDDFQYLWQQMAEESTDAEVRQHWGRFLGARFSEGKLPIRFLSLDTGEKELLQDCLRSINPAHWTAESWMQLVNQVYAAYAKDETFDSSWEIIRGLMLTHESAVRGVLQKQICRELYDVKIRFYYHLMLLLGIKIENETIAHLASCVKRCLSNYSSALYILELEQSTEMLEDLMYWSLNEASDELVQRATFKTIRGILEGFADEKSLSDA